MSKYKIRRSRWPQRRFEAGHWAPYGLGEQAMLRFPSGEAWLWRIRGARGWAMMRFTLGGALHNVEVRPAPTRAGLVRIACREIRRIVKEKA